MKFLFYLFAKIFIFLKNIIRFLFREYYKYFSYIGIFTVKFNRLINSILFRNYLKIQKLDKKNFFKRNSIYTDNQVKTYLNCLDQLEKKGFTKIKLSDLNLNNVFSIKNFLIEVSTKYKLSIDELENENLIAHKDKNYWKEIYRQNYNYESYNPEDPVQELILNDAINKIAYLYLKRKFFLQELNFYCSPKSKTNLNDKTLIGSQGWHLDNQWNSQFKIFYSPYTLNKNCGPTTLYPADLSKNLEYPNYPGYFNDETAQENGFNLNSQKEMDSTPEEIFIADTSRCFHYGSRNVKKSRFLLIIALAPIPYNLSPFFVRKGLKEGFNFKYLNSQIKKFFIRYK